MLAVIRTRVRTLVVGLDCAKEAMDSSMAVNEGPGRGAKEPVDNCHGRVDSDSRVSFSCTHSPEECVHDRRHAAGDADRASPEDSAALAGSSRTGPDVIEDARLDGHDSESDDNCSSETSSLEACMTPSGQDYCLRRGGTPRRRSALRLSRIIARQQLLHRLSRGRDTAFCEIFVLFFGQNSLTLGLLLFHMKPCLGQDFLRDSHMLKNLIYLLLHAS